MIAKANGAFLETYENIADILFDRARQDPDRPVFRERKSALGLAVDKEAWSSMSLSEAKDRVLSIGYAMIQAGVQPGDRVALLSNNCIAWVLVDLATAMIGGILVPIYPSLTDEQAAQIMVESEPKLCFVEDPKQAQKILNRPEGLDSVLRVILFSTDVDGAEPTKGTSQLSAFDEVLNQFPDLSSGYLWTLESFEATAYEVPLPRVPSTDTATIVYTSGTTGEQKGVMLSHETFVFVTSSVLSAIKTNREDRILLFLPMAHIFGRVVVLTALRSGAQIDFARGVTHLLRDLQETKPTILPAVPRVYEKIHLQMLAEAKKLTGARKRLYDWAFEIGQERATSIRAGHKVSSVTTMQYKLAKKLVFSKLHNQLGGSIRLLLSGGAPLSRSVGEWFHDAGFLILEGYGLSETAGVSVVNRENHFKFGRVGVPLDGIEVRTAANGEILIRGRNVMRGYYKKREQTDLVLEPHGWFHTGDVGEFDEDGFLMITDRLKDLIITASGKNIACAAIEAKLRSSTFISQALVHGDKRNFL